MGEGGHVSTKIKTFFKKQLPAFYLFIARFLTLIFNNE